MTWEAVIGLEIHAQIKSRSKLTSPAGVAFGALPNTQVDYVDAGLPGMLPTMNAACIAQGIRSGLALGGSIRPVSVFDRKHYFYPDLPFGYQITQFKHPIMENGRVDIITGAGSKTVRVQRLHLEQDAGKNVHGARGSSIDLNRAGVGLMEIVSDPDLRTAQEAVAYAKKVRSILVYVGTCEGVLAHGHMRFDANVSMRRPGGPLGIRAELKNINSFKFLEEAVKYEIKRQTELLERGEAMVQETRLFDEKRGITVSMRKKEDACDYRYFPDPDLPPLRVSDAQISAAKADLPMLPDAKMVEWAEKHGLSRAEAALVADEWAWSALFEETVLELEARGLSEGVGRLVWTWTTGVVFAEANRLEEGAPLPLSPKRFADFLELVARQTVSIQTAKALFPEVWAGADPSALVAERGLSQIVDISALKTIVETALEGFEKQKAEYHAGNAKLMAFFIGKAMAATQGRARPDLIQQAVSECLKGL